MSEPMPPPPMDPMNNVIWCTACEIHLAMTHQPLCPTCLDERVRGMQ